MFINCSNHKSPDWTPEQKRAAEVWGEIVDFPFPAVDANADEQEIVALADRISEEIVNMKPAAVMCQGEFTLTYALIKNLSKQRIPVVAACSERRTIETKLENGETEKVSRFEFVRFRRYE